MLSEDILIEVKDLRKCYEIYGSPRDRLKQLFLPSIFGLIGRVVKWLFPNRTVNSSKYYKEFWALDGVSFQIRRGETFGIIGKNGSGKSTLLQILAGTLTPTSGEVKVKGRVAALLELGSGFNPEFTGKENVFLNARILGLTQKEILNRYEKIVEFADIGDFIDRPVKTYSSGMFVRLAFAVQAHVDASIMIIDEALAVGDVFFRQKCYTRLEQLHDSGTAIILVSHSMPDIEQFCKNALLLSQGKQHFIGLATDASKHYMLESQKILMDDNSAKIYKKKDDDNFITSQSKLNQQVSNGQGRCLTAYSTNKKGEDCNIFKQGEIAIFHYKFEVFDPIGVPICGILIKDHRGIFVHGKTNWEVGGDVPTVNNKSTVYCSHEIKLDLALGEYTYEAGLAAVSQEVWSKRGHMSHDNFAINRTRICHKSNSGQFSIISNIANDVPIKSHYGLVDLQTEINIKLETCKQNNFKNSLSDNTIFHITHYKAGSQWIHKILRDIFDENVIPPKSDMSQYLKSEIVHGGVYPTLYLSHQQFFSKPIPESYKSFIVIRDLRDTLISAYFSLLKSHNIEKEHMAKWRTVLQKTSLEDGLLLVMENWLYWVADIQESWIRTSSSIYKYEDLITQDVEMFEKIIIDQCAVNISKERLREIVIANKFENITGGRKPGEEDVNKHERKGIAGDWENYFTPRVTEEFNKRYGQLIVDAGYIL